MRYIFHLCVTVALLSRLKCSVLFTRQSGALESFYDPGNLPGDDYIDITDAFDADGVDIDVTGDNYKVLGIAITNLRCFDAGWCDCDTSALTTTTADIPVETTGSTGISISKSCLIAPYVYTLATVAMNYHISYKKVSKAAGNADHVLKRIAEEVDLALHRYPGTWDPTNALIVTWKVELLSGYAPMRDVIQAILSTDGSTTYAIFIYDSVTGIESAGSVRGFISSNTGSSPFARICPKLAPSSTTPANTAALDADLMTDSNRGCANKGTFVFDVTSASTCVDPAASCGIDNDANCKTAVAAQDTCTENYLCTVDTSGTTATFTFYIKWYKFARLQAIDYATFIGSGDETNPDKVTSLMTDAACGTDLPNPDSSSATTADSFSVTITLATPECGVVVDTTAGSIKFALLNYEGNGLGDAADLNYPYDMAGKAYFWGTCHFLDSTVTAVEEFRTPVVPTSLPARTGGIFGFKVVDEADKATAQELSSVQIGQLYYLQICYTPGAPFNLYADSFGITGTTCRVSNVNTFPASPTGHEQVATFISTGCPVADNVLNLKQAFEGDPGNADPPDGSQWCINAGPFTASRWNKFGMGVLVDKIFFECVVDFCSVPQTETLCSDSCATDPIARRRRSTSNSSEILHTSVNIVDDPEEEKQCVDTTVAISTIAALNVMLVLSVTMVTIIFMKTRVAKRRRFKADRVYSLRTHSTKLSMNSII